jgi:CRISPR-associated endonuclease/helicase Cas3
MTLPKPEQFTEFYEALHGYPPFPWQVRLAQQVCAGTWPEAIALPTAAGKTASIDVAVFALACRAPNAPRRIFFVVDRRIVVDQAFDHAKKIAAKLKHAKGGILKSVADSLLEIAGAGAETPLDVYALRGGMYRETAWARSPLQPVVIASTVDQVGSRLLFRGYGVSDGMKPVHAGLVGNDSIILLDEAHCAKPFEQTVKAVRNYSAWGESPVQAVKFVPITATPTATSEVMRDDDADRNHPVLGKRINASKPAKLVVADKAKGKNFTGELVKALEKEAKELAVEGGCVGIIVNRVKTARELKTKLGNDAVLLTGRMRPLDRDSLMAGPLQSLISGAGGTPPKFVIGTQCLEVGADFDFTALVSECASLDALRQRFGRLNRIAARADAKATIVVRGDQTEEDDDPVYGTSLCETWKWLSDSGKRKVFDFGVAAVRATLDGMSAEELSKLNAPVSDAPVMFPAHVDCWVQTHPIPTPDPDVALFLHGPAKLGQPDVQVVFRSDLGRDTDQWADIVSLCPPSSSEAVAVPIGLFKRWLADDMIDDPTGDTEGEAINAEGELAAAARYALLWQGEENSELVTKPDDVRPTKTYVVPCEAPDITKLADLLLNDDGLPKDYAEEAYQRSRDKALLRLPLELPEDIDKEEERELVRAAIDKYAEGVNDESPLWQHNAVKYFQGNQRREVTRHPNDGVVVAGKRRLHQFDPTYLEDSEPASSFLGRPITLHAHSRGVARYAEQFAKGCNLDTELFRTAGLYHDLGKLDPRFQKLLKGFHAGEPFAKSGNFIKRDPAVHQYPKNARHELLSAAIVAQHTSDDLLLHLIATHHGSARPFARAVEENDAAAPITGQFIGLDATFPSSRQDIAGWNAELPERFWRIVRKYGWWGSAYLETVFRLSDHSQSRDEQDKEFQDDKASVRNGTLAPLVPKLKMYELSLPGLDGSNPLAFLAALGTLSICRRISESEKPPEAFAHGVRMSWNRQARPVLHLAQPMTSDELVDAILRSLEHFPESHSCAWAFELLKADKETIVVTIRNRWIDADKQDSIAMSWVTAFVCESSPEAASQLQTVRKDYLIGNIVSVLSRTTNKHLERTLFQTWDYADALANQSLHWEPTEDRRHAYQWHVPSGDPTRNKQGGMLGANRLAFEAWPLFPSFPTKETDRVATRGFRGNRANNTFLTWPLWQQPLSYDAIASLLGLESVQDSKQSAIDLLQSGVFNRFRLQRILVGKTPNFTTSTAIV